MYHPVLNSLPAASNLVKAGSAEISLDQVASIKVLPDGSTQYDIRKPTDMVAGVRLGPDAGDKAMNQLNTLGGFMGDMAARGAAHHAAAMHQANHGVMDVAPQADLAKALLQTAATTEAQQAPAHHPLASAPLMEGSAAHTKHTDGITPPAASHAAAAVSHTAHASSSPTSWMNRVSSSEPGTGGPAL